MRRLPLALMMIALVATLPGSAIAQQFPGLAGVEGRFGVVWPENARAGGSLAVDVDFGRLVLPGLKVVGGWNRFSADVDRRVGGERARGSVTATGIRAGLRLTVPTPATARPYGTAALVAYTVSADVDDPGTESILEGFYVGASLGGGLTYGLFAGDRLALTTEVRRTRLSNVAHWAAELGLRVRLSLR